MAAHRKTAVKPGSAAAVRRALLTEIDDALARLPARRTPSDVDVHEVRKGLKRARAMLRLLRPALGPRAYARADAALRQAGHDLAPARDATVMADLYATLAGLTTTTDTPQGSADGAATAAAPSRDVLATTRRNLRSGYGWLERAPLLASGWTTLGEGFRAVYRQARRRMPPSRRAATMASLHAWRRSTKRYWHVLEVFQPVRPHRLGAALREAHRISDLLGEDHDLALLEQHLLARHAAPQPQDVRVLRLIGPRRRQLQKEALRRGAKLYATRPRQAEAALHRDWERWRAHERASPARGR